MGFGEDFIQKKTPSQKAIEEILGTRNVPKEGFDYFSVTRVRTDSQSQFAENYFRHLLTVLEAEGYAVAAFPLDERVHIPSYNGAAPHTYIIGEQDTEMQGGQRLVELLESCPEGPVLEAIKAEFRANSSGKRLYADIWGRQNEFPAFLKAAQDREKHILVVENGPIVYARKDLENVLNLFLGPSTVHTKATDYED